MLYGNTDLVNVGSGDDLWPDGTKLLLLPGNVLFSFVKFYGIHVHWNKKVVILTTFSSLAALEVVILTSGATSDEKGVNMTTFCFQF